MCVRPHYSHVRVCDLQGIWSSPFSYPLLFSKSCPSISLYDVPFLSFSSVFWNHWSISAVVSIGILCVFFPIIATRVCVCVCDLQGIWSSPFLILFSFLSCPSMMFLPFPVLLCFYGPLIYICCSFHGRSMRVFPHYSHFHFHADTFSLSRWLSSSTAASGLRLCSWFHGHHWFCSHHTTPILPLLRPSSSRTTTSLPHWVANRQRSESSICLSFGSMSGKLSSHPCYSSTVQGLVGFHLNTSLLVQDLAG